MGTALVAARAPGRTHVSAVWQGRLRVVPIAEVRYFLADHKYVAAGFPGGELLLEDSLRQLELDLGTPFLRVHRNALVAIAHVEALERGENGLICVRLRDVSRRLVVSRRLLATVRVRLDNGRGEVM